MSEFVDALDAAYRQVGAFFVEFSRLMRDMRSSLDNAFGRESVPIARLITAEMTPGPIANAYFAVLNATRQKDLDDGELKVVRRLQVEVATAITRRNDMAHGDWWIGFSKAGSSDVMDAPLLERVKPSRTQGAEVLSVLDTVAMDSEIKNLITLRSRVMEIDYLSRWSDTPHRVRDFFRVLSGTGIVRDGPLADTEPPPILN